jgi:phosphate starvation-inducible membrane PsiE
MLRAQLLKILKVWFHNLLVSIFHRITLFCIGALTVWSSVDTFSHILSKNAASIQDLLLLFIFLEIGAMVGIYFKTNHMPVRFLIYVAITAVTRLIIDLVGKHEANFEIFLLGVTILALAIANANLTLSHKSKAVINRTKTLTLSETLEELVKIYDERGQICQ